MSHVDASSPPWLSLTDGETQPPPALCAVHGEGVAAFQCIAVPAPFHLCPALNFERGC